MHLFTFTFTASVQDCSRGILVVSDGTCIWYDFITSDSPEPDKLKYVEAKTDCQQRGMMLAKIDTQDKYEALKQIPSP